MPLHCLAVNTKVVGMVAQVEVSQRYANSDYVPIEAVYGTHTHTLFFLKKPPFTLLTLMNMPNGTTRFKFKQEGCSLYSFEAIVDDQLFVGGIKEKEEALNAYDDAISSGGRGFLLTQDDKIAGAFSLNVGNLPPGKVCSKKRLSVCMLLHLLLSVHPSVHRSVITFRYMGELTIKGEFVCMNLLITRLPIFGNATTTSSTNHNLKCAAKH